MAYYNTRMSDGGGGRTVKKPVFYTSAPKTQARTSAPKTQPRPGTTAPKANEDTQTRYEEMIRKQEEQARLAAEAKARADAEAKRQKTERDNWENWMNESTVDDKKKVLASSTPPPKPKQSFWNMATAGIEDFFQGLGQMPNAIPSQAQAALDVKRNNPEPFADVKKFYQDWKEADKAGEAKVKQQYQELFKPLPRKNPLNSQKSPSFWDSLKSNKFDNRYPAPTTDKGFYLHERIDKPVIDPKNPSTDAPWRNQPLFRPENYHPDVERWWEKELQDLPGLGSNVVGEIVADAKKKKLLEGYAAQQAEAMPSTPIDVPDKNSLFYWNNANKKQFDFSRYPNPEKAAKQADLAYDQIRRNYDYLTSMKDSEYEAWQKRALIPTFWDDPSIPGEPLQGIRKAFMDYPTVNPNFPIGQRIMNENLTGKKENTYSSMYRQLLQDREPSKGETVLNNLGEAIEQTEGRVPTLSNEEKAQMSGYNNLADYYKYVWDNDDPASKPSQDTKYIGGTDPQTGQYYILPLSVFMYDRSMFMDPGLMDSFFGGGHPVRNDVQGYALHNPRAPRPAQANEPLSQFVDYYLPPWITSGVLEEPAEAEAPAPVDYGGGGYGYGDGGYSGGSYWSPSGYYDNEYVKDRYGYFQNLAKWVI